MIERNARGQGSKGRMLQGARAPRPQSWPEPMPAQHAPAQSMKESPCTQSFCFVQAFNCSDEAHHTGESSLLN